MTNENEEQKERDLLEALDGGIASRRSRPGVWERVDARVRRYIDPARRSNRPR